MESFTWAEVGNLARANIALAMKKAAEAIDPPPRKPVSGEEFVGRVPHNLQPGRYCLFQIGNKLFLKKLSMANITPIAGADRMLFFRKSGRGELIITEEVVGS